MKRDEADRSGGREQRRSTPRQGQPVKADECKGGEGGGMGMGVGGKGGRGKGLLSHFSDRRSRQTLTA